MQSYEQLDAFRACNALTLRTERVLRQIEDFDPELSAQLWSAALIASSRIARGTGMSNRRMFVACLDRTLGALAEVGYHLQIVRSLDLIEEKTARELESLRGRAVFYATKLLNGLMDGTEGAS